MEYLNQGCAAELLASQLGGGRCKWFGYLTKNARNWQKQHGYKITVHVENGKLAYTKSALMAFVGVMQPTVKAA